MKRSWLIENADNAGLYLQMVLMGSQRWTRDVAKAAVADSEADALTFITQFLGGRGRAVPA